MTGSETRSSSDSTGARIVLVGELGAQLTDSGMPTPAIDACSLLARGITLRGTVLHADHLGLIPEWYHQFGTGLRAGTLTFPRSRLHGLDDAPGPRADWPRAATWARSWWSCDASASPLVLPPP